jgi:neuronal guanine nucleotide exchange factor
MEAVSPKTTSTNPDEKIYEDWDCPQVEAVENYAAQDSDELALKKGEGEFVIINMSDSGMEDSKDSVAVHYDAY